MSHDNASIFNVLATHPPDVIGQPRQTAYVYDPDRELPDMQAGFRYWTSSQGTVPEPSWLYSSEGRLGSYGNQVSYEDLPYYQAGVSNERGLCQVLSLPTARKSFARSDGSLLGPLPDEMPILLMTLQGPDQYPFAAPGQPGGTYTEPYVDRGRQADANQMDEADDAQDEQKRDNPPLRIQPPPPPRLALPDAGVPEPRRPPPPPRRPPPRREQDDNSSGSGTSSGGFNTPSGYHTPAGFSTPPLSPKAAPTRSGFKFLDRMRQGFSSVGDVDIAFPWRQPLIFPRYDGSSVRQESVIYPDGLASRTKGPKKPPVASTGNNAAPTPSAPAPAKAKASGPSMPVEPIVSGTITVNNKQISITAPPAHPGNKAISAPLAPPANPTFGSRPAMGQQHDIRSPAGKKREKPNDDAPFPPIPSHEIVLPGQRSSTKDKSRKSMSKQKQKQIRPVSGNAEQPQPQPQSKPQGLPSDAIARLRAKKSALMKKARERDNPPSPGPFAPRRAAPEQPPLSQDDVQEAKEESDFIETQRQKRNQQRLHAIGEQLDDQDRLNELLDLFEGVGETPSGPINVTQRAIARRANANDANFDRDVQDRLYQLDLQIAAANIPSETRIGLAEARDLIMNDNSTQAEREEAFHFIAAVINRALHNMDLDEEDEKSMEAAANTRFTGSRALRPPSSASTGGGGGGGGGRSSPSSLPSNAGANIDPADVKQQDANTQDIAMSTEPAQIDPGYAANEPYNPLGITSVVGPSIPQPAFSATPANDFNIREITAEYKTMLNNALQRHEADISDNFNNIIQLLQRQRAAERTESRIQQQGYIAYLESLRLHNAMDFQAANTRFDQIEEAFLYEADQINERLRQLGHNRTANSTAPAAANIDVADPNDAASELLVKKDELEVRARKNAKRKNVAEQRYLLVEAELQNDLEEAMMMPELEAIQNGHKDSEQIAGAALNSLLLADPSHINEQDVTGALHHAELVIESEELDLIASQVLSNAGAFSDSALEVIRDDIEHNLREMLASSVMTNVTTINQGIHVANDVLHQMERFNTYWRLWSDDDFALLNIVIANQVAQFLNTLDSSFGTDLQTTFNNAYTDILQTTAESAAPHVMMKLQIAAFKAVLDDYDHQRNMPGRIHTEDDLKMQHVNSTDTNNALGMASVVTVPTPRPTGNAILLSSSPPEGGPTIYRLSQPAMLYMAAVTTGRMGFYPGVRSFEPTREIVEYDPFAEDQPTTTTLLSPRHRKRSSSDITPSRIQDAGDFAEALNFSPINRPGSRKLDAERRERRLDLIPQARPQFLEYLFARANTLGPSPDQIRRFIQAIVDDDNRRAMRYMAITDASQPAWNAMRAIGYSLNANSTGIESSQFTMGNQDDSTAQSIDTSNPTAISNEPIFSRTRNRPPSDFERYYRPRRGFLAGHGEPSHVRRRRRRNYGK